MTRLIRLSIFLVLVLVLAATAQAGDKLFLWKMEGDNATVHLTGSIHVGKPDFFPLADPIEKAFAASDVLAVEVDISDPEVVAASSVLVMQRGMLPEGVTLSDRLDPETWTRLETYCQENGVPLAMFNQMKPGIMAVVLAMNAYQQVGFDPELGIDKHFLMSAKQAKKEVRQLEKVEDQLEIFFSVTDELDDPLIVEMLDQMGDLEGYVQEMIDHWQSGDPEALDAFMQENIGDDEELQAFYRTLLDDRNVAMVETIDTWLDGDQDVFVVVGAAHYGGDKGILKLLAEKGRKVKQIEDKR
ncbi:MAG: TraB/GumN family protein [bacterium]|nr:TraB/GumN family protein [bacterium]